MAVRPSLIGRRALLLSAAGVAVAGCSAEPSSTPAPSADTPSHSPTASPSAAPTASSPSSSPSASPSSTPSPTGTPTPRIESTIITGLDVPWGIAFLSSGNALVSERNTGRVIKVRPDGSRTSLGTVDGVQAPTGYGEGGLLGLALDPDDETTVFAYLTSSSDNRVVRFSIAGGRVGRPTAIVTGIPTSTHHHGGRLLFGESGLLYVSTGDAEQPALAQDRSSLAGKILRVRRDGRAAPGNPYDNRTWSYGHRNVQGLALDADHRLWATEFGDKASDELNLIIAGGNYGWPNVEGRSEDRRYQEPKATWSPTSTSSPSGLAITRSTAFVAALQGQCLFSIPLDGRSAGTPVRHFAGDHGRLRTVAVAPDGALWLTSSNTDGRVTPGRNDDKIFRVSF